MHPLRSSPPEIVPGADTDPNTGPRRGPAHEKAR